MAELTQDFTGRDSNGRNYVDPSTQFARVDRDVTFQNDVEFDGAINHDGSTLGLFGTAPTTQQATIPDPTGGVVIDENARNAIDAILDLLQAYGLMA